MLINDARNIVLKIIMNAIAKSVLIGRMIYIVKINPKIAVSIKLDGNGAGFQPLKNQVFFPTLFCFLLLELFLPAIIPITSFKYRKGKEYLKVTGIDNCLAPSSRNSFDDLNDSDRGKTLPGMSLCNRPFENFEDPKQLRESWLIPNANYNTNANYNIQWKLF